VDVLRLARISQLWLRHYRLPLQEPRLLIFNTALLLLSDVPTENVIRRERL
jgi:hypothetical protein